MSKRAICLGCEYILPRCLCSSLKTINNTTQIIILQHPDETRHALNTVKILKRSLSKIKIFIGEDFTLNEELNSIISLNKDSIAVIFPTTFSTELNQNSKKIMTHLILIDGTWKKARKIHLLSKNLHTLNTYSLLPQKAGQYRIRSGQVKNSLSTLEATIDALKYIECDLDTKSLEDSFLKMIDIQIDKMGEEVFKKNY